MRSNRDRPVRSTRRRVAVIALAAVMLAALPTALPASMQAAGPDRFDDAREYIRRAMAERDLPSVAVAVAREGEVLWEEAFGWADRERRVPATPHTLYSLASISKPITATGVMRLVGQGAVELDRPANDYLGAGRITGLAGDASAATVRRVLSHTAGLPLHYRFFYEDDPHPPASPAQAIARYGVLVNPPGAVYEYSNLGYGILDQVIEHVSGDDYADFMRREVFAPLGFTRTSVHLTPALEAYAATRYDEDMGRVPYYGFDHDGASAVWSSAHDLIRFGLLHLGHPPVDRRPVLADSMRVRMQRPATPDSSTSGYGLGWFVQEDDHGLRSIWHSGSMPGVSTMLRLYPSEDVAVVVLLNTLDRRMRLRIAQELVAAVVPQYAEALREARERERRAQAAGGDEQGDGFRPPPELEGEWTGMVRTYERERPLALVVRPDGDVHVRLGDQPEALLNGVRYRDGRLTGRFSGTIPTGDASRHEHTVRLDLRLRDGVLSGSATAQTTSDPVYFALSSYAELTRSVPAEAAPTAAVERGLRPLVEVDGRSRGPWTLRERMRHYRVPGLSIAVIDDGRIAWAKGYGAADAADGRAVTPRTLFQAASISKPVAALAALRLVRQGRLALDEDVNRTLSSWLVPETELADAEPVTLRGILTHSAGLTVHGFRGYARDEAVPSTVQVLDGAGPANSAAIRVDTEPGTEWRYSGGGYTVMQLLLRDVAGRPFPALMRGLVLEPIGMDESTYRQPLPDARSDQAAAGHRSDGEPTPGEWHTYPEMAAAGLWTTPSDLARYILEVQAALAGRSDRVLDRETARAMLTPHLGDWGLGPSLQGEGETLRFSHGGSNQGFRGHFIGYARAGRGAVVMTNSDNGGPLAQEVLGAIARAFEWPDSPPRRVVTPVDPPAGAYDDIVGSYALERDSDVVLAITRDGDGLAASLQGGPASPLAPIGRDEYVSLDAGTEIRFERGDDGRVTAAVLRGVRLVRRPTASDEGAGAGR